MCRWTTGKAHPATIVVTPSLAMIATIAKIVTAITAPDAAPIVRFVTRRFVSAVAMNVLTVINLSANTAQLHVRNAKRRFVKIVLTKKDYVITA